MTKFRAFIAGAVLAAVVASLIITQERSTTGRLRKEMELLQSQRDQLSDLAAENARRSMLVEQSIRPKASQEEPSHELLRLRGEVDRLRQEHAELGKLRQENRQLRGPSMTEMYAISGVDTNGIPDVELGATRTDVLAELRKVGASVLTDEEKYIHAEVFPMAVASPDSSRLALGMEFYFDGGTLTSRRDWPKW
jgi:hypothetical protein